MSMILSGISVSAANDAATEEGQSMESSQTDQNQQQMNDEADQEINQEIENLYEQKKKNLLYMACSGYERLAFGNIVDAIKLVYSENFNLNEINELDLFNISEIKKLKDGAMEIKFFDRIKALEKLQQMNFSSQKQALTFYDAIEKGTTVFNGSCEE